jgi:AraC-like DNA-binding protein
MKYHTFPPPPSLAEFVRSFWVYEVEVRPGEPYVYRSMADGCAEIVFHYKARFDEFTAPGIGQQTLSCLHAQTRRFRRFVTHEDFGIFGVYLYPFAIPRLFSLSSADVSDLMPDMESLLGQEGRDLEEKMMLAKNNKARLQILTAFLEGRLRRSPGINAIESSVKYIIQSKGIFSVKEIAGRFCLSARQFERKFKDLSGFSPKEYSRIIRFQAACKEYGNKQRSLTSIAYECGYYDQSHFIHDFVAFSGYHPRQYFGHTIEGGEWRDA